MMTNTEVTARAIAVALDANNSASWGKDQAQTAMGVCTKLYKSGQCDDNEFTLAVARLGNHSATRQHLEKHGLLAVQKDALALAIVAEQEKMMDEVTAAVTPKA